MKLNFKENNGPIDEVIAQLIELAEGIYRPRIVREMILASLKAGQEDDGRVDLKLMNTSLKEMRYTAKVFHDYHHIKKVTAFGSARTRPSELIYKMARLLGKKLSDFPADSAPSMKPWKPSPWCKPASETRCRSSFLTSRAATTGQTGFVL